MKQISYTAMPSSACNRLLIAAPMDPPETDERSESQAREPFFRPSLPKDDDAMNCASAGAAALVL